MADANKFINTYIDVAIGNINELTSASLQLKTQLKISNDLISEKDQVINNLLKEKESFEEQLKVEKEKNSNIVQEKLEQDKNFITKQLEEEQTKIKNEISLRDQKIKELSDKIVENESKIKEIDTIQKNSKIWEDSYNAMKNKVSHMDTLNRQIITMKSEITLKNETISSLQNDINTLKTQLIENSSSNNSINKKKSKSEKKSIDLEKPSLPIVDDF